MHRKQVKVGIYGITHTIVPHVLVPPNSLTLALTRQ